MTALVSHGHTLFYFFQMSPEGLRRYHLYNQKCKLKYIPFSFKKIICGSFLLQHQWSKNIWERYLGAMFEEGKWSGALESISKSFLCNRLTESQYRILHRLQQATQFFNVIDLSTSPLCIDCIKDTGSYFHCIWQCPLISKFWEKIAGDFLTIM